MPGSGIPANGPIAKVTGHVARTLATAGLDPDVRLLVAVSGGCDSVVLLDALRLLGRSVAIVHVHHGLRGPEADADAAFVRWLAGPDDCHVFRRDAAAHARKNSISIETSGRDLRRACFARAARATGLRHLALAHHADDQAETLLWNLARGSGLNGLAAMAPVSTQVLARGIKVDLLRPILDLRRRDLLAHARARGLVWREDATNHDLSFTRNRIRHEVLPALDRASDRDPVPAIVRFARVAREEDALLDSLSRDALAAIQRGKHSLDLAGLRALPAALARRALQSWLVSLTGSPASFREIEDGLAIARANHPPSRCNLTGGHHLARRQKCLHFEPAAGKRPG